MGKTIRRSNPSVHRVLHRSCADMNRALLPFVVFASIVACAPSQVSQPDFRLQVVPATVYKVDDPGNTRTSSFVFDIAVICSTDCALNPISASVELSSAGSIVERQDWTTEMLAKIKGVKYRISPDTPLAAPLRMFTLPEAFDLHFYFRCPQGLAIDSASVRVTSRRREGQPSGTDPEDTDSVLPTEDIAHPSLSWSGRCWAGLGHERRPRRGHWH